LLPCQPSSTLFPYTTLFRSLPARSIDRLFGRRNLGFRSGYRRRWQFWLVAKRNYCTFFQGLRIADLASDEPRLSALRRTWWSRRGLLGTLLVPPTYLGFSKGTRGNSMNLQQSSL